MGRCPSYLAYLGVRLRRDRDDFERITAADARVQFPECCPATRTEIDCRRRASQAFVGKLLKELREGIRTLAEALMETEV